MITGIVATALWGVIGALAAELIRLSARLKRGDLPSGLELLGALISVLLGAGSVIYGWTAPRPPLELATLGAAFPLVFAAAVRGVHETSSTRARPAGTFGAAPSSPRSRSLWSYWTS